jgi:hypothetical protein
MKPAYALLAEAILFAHSSYLLATKAPPQRRAGRFIVAGAGEPSWSYLQTRPA